MRFWAIGQGVGEQEAEFVRETLADVGETLLNYVDAPEGSTVFVIGERHQQAPTGVRCIEILGYPGVVPGDDGVFRPSTLRLVALAGQMYDLCIWHSAARAGTIVAHTTGIDQYAVSLTVPRKWIDWGEEVHAKELKGAHGALSDALTSCPIVGIGSVAIRVLDPMPARHGVVRRIMRNFGLNFARIGTDSDGDAGADLVVELADVRDYARVYQCLDSLPLRNGVFYPGGGSTWGTPARKQ